MQEVREAQSVKHREANSAKMKMKGLNFIFKPQNKYSHGSGALGAVQK